VIAAAALAIIQIVSALPTSKVVWDWSVLSQTPIRFEVRYNAGTPASVGMPRLEAQDVSGVTQAYAASLPVLNAGPNTVDVRACFDATECGEWSLALPFTMEQPAPVCADMPSVFVTRWAMTSGKPGSRMRIDYQLASVSPIIQIRAKVAGTVVAVVTGTDLRDSGGIWFTTPASGRYTLALEATNAAGCVKESLALVDLVVK
jgi:hypothetical protein